MGGRRSSREPATRPAASRDARGVVLDYRGVERPAGVFRLEARLDIAQHERALESGPDYPGKVIRRVARDAEQAPREGPKRRCHRAERSAALSGVSSQ